MRVQNFVNIHTLVLISQRIKVLSGMRMFFSAPLVSSECCWTDGGVWSVINDGSTSLNKVQQETEPLSLKDPRVLLIFYLQAAVVAKSFFSLHTL